MAQLSQKQYENPPIGSGCARILVIQGTQPFNIVTVQEDKTHHRTKQKDVDWNKQRPQTDTGLPGGRVRPDESIDDAFLRELDEEVLGLPRVMGTLCRDENSLQLNIDPPSQIIQILRPKTPRIGVPEIIGELVGLSPFYLEVAADHSEHRLYIVLLRRLGERLRTEGIPDESLPPQMTAIWDFLTHKNTSPYHFTHRVLAAHGFLYFLDHILPVLDRRVEELAGFRGSKEEFEARDAARYFLSSCTEKFQR